MCQEYVLHSNHKSYVKAERRSLKMCFQFSTLLIKCIHFAKYRTTLYHPIERSYDIEQGMLIHICLEIRCV